MEGASKQQSTYRGMAHSWLTDRRTTYIIPDLRCIAAGAKLTINKTNRSVSDGCATPILPFIPSPFLFPLVSGFPARQSNWEGVYVVHLLPSPLFKSISSPPPSQMHGYIGQASARLQCLYNGDERCTTFCSVCCCGWMDVMWSELLTLAVDQREMRIQIHNAPLLPLAQFALSSRIAAAVSANAKRQRIYRQASCTAFSSCSRVTASLLSRELCT